VPAWGGRPASVAGEASTGVAWSVPAGGHRRWGGQWRVEAGVGRGERRRARGVVQMLARGGAWASWSARGGASSVGRRAPASWSACGWRRRWGGRWRVQAGVGATARGGARGRRLRGSSNDGRGVGGSSGEEGGVAVAGIHDLVTGS